jgi:phenylacetic acid degradation operon negative regulatory protein
LLARFERRRPIRSGSLIITLYGDAIAPRGGSLWLGSLNGLLAPLGVEPGLVRTALSRLVSEGWFERNRVGQNSFYRLSSHGAAEFIEAGKHIYAGEDPAWNGKLDVRVLTDPEPKKRQALRDRLALQGYGQLAVNVMVRPSRQRERGPRQTAQSDTMRLTATADDPDDARRLAETCWRLEDLGAAHDALLDDIAGLARAPQDLARLDDAHAFQVRLLLIHEWRRVALHDPLLPRSLLPVNWPGTEARDAVRRIYRAVTAGCERWLDANAINERGRLPPAGKVTARRFSAPP